MKIRKTFNVQKLFYVKRKAVTNHIKVTAIWVEAKFNIFKCQKLMCKILIEGIHKNS